MVKGFIHIVGILEKEERENWAEAIIEEILARESFQAAVQEGGIQVKVSSLSELTR